MSRQCEICGKKPQFGNKISHAHNLTRRRFNPNLHKMRVIINNVSKKAVICTSCLSAGKVKKA